MIDRRHPPADGGPRSWSSTGSSTKGLHEALVPRRGWCNRHGTPRAGVESTLADRQRKLGEQPRHEEDEVLEGIHRLDLGLEVFVHGDADLPLIQRKRHAVLEVQLLDDQSSPDLGRVDGVSFV